MQKLSTRFWVKNTDILKNLTCTRVLLTSYDRSIRFSRPRIATWRSHSPLSTLDSRRTPETASINWKFATICPVRRDRSTLILYLEFLLNLTTLTRLCSIPCQLALTEFLSVSAQFNSTVAIFYSNSDYSFSISPQFLLEHMQRWAEAIARPGRSMILPPPCDQNTNFRVRT